MDKFMYIQACKFNHYMHICLARNYREALSHCGHGHDLTSVAQLSVINIGGAAAGGRTQTPTGDASLHGRSQ